AEAVGGLLGLGSEPAAGVLEDHDVAAVGVARSRRELRDEHAVAYEERGAHRAARDEERLDQEGLDEEGQRERGHDDDRGLLERRERSVATVRAGVLGDVGLSGLAHGTTVPLRRHRTSSATAPYLAGVVSRFSLIFAFLPRRARR